MEIRERLINLRNERHLSQQEFADMLDVSRTTVARWESGKNLPSSAQIANICKVFRLNIGELMSDADDICGEDETVGRQDKSAPAATSEGDKRHARGRKPIVFTVVALCLLAAAAIAGLVITIVYAVKDASYDTAVTVWIMTIPRNTPMIVLCVFIAVFIALAAILIYILLRKKK